MSTGFVKSRRAAVDMIGYRLAAFTPNAAEVAMAAGANAPLAGVTDRIGAPAGRQVDVYFTEMAPVQAGGPIAPGDRITADAQGRAVKAVKQAGATVFTIGFAQEPAVVNDVFNVLIAPGAIDG